jgi:hypothetical protein
MVVVVGFSLTEVDAMSKTRALAIEARPLPLRRRASLLGRRKFPLQ